MADLFEEGNARRRERLVQLGWYECWGKHWRRPDGQIVSEAEAFAYLDGLDQQKESEGTSDGR